MYAIIAGDWLKSNANVSDRPNHQSYSLLLTCVAAEIYDVPRFNTYVQAFSSRALNSANSEVESWGPGEASG